MMIFRFMSKYKYFSIFFSVETRSLHTTALNAGINIYVTISIHFADAFYTIATDFSWLSFQGII